MHDLIALDDRSKVWIYQAAKPFTIEQVEEIKGHIVNFVGKWASHNNALLAYGNLFHYRYLGLFVDETRSMASGCSIDTSVHFVKELGQKYNVDFFDRMTYTYMVDEQVHTIHHNQMKAAYADGLISDETLFFNNLVKDKGEFLTQWIIPLKDSWQHKFV